MRQQSGNEIKWSAQTADAYILTTKGNPYGDPPDVAGYLRYAFKERGLQEVLKRGTAQELEDIHILFCAKIRDETLRRIDATEKSLFVFSAMKIAERLSDLTGQNWYALDPQPIKEELAA
ncbi:MAG: hypothetical protein WAV73_02195 [Candidatus Moraniibacteriota bacterium]